MINPNLLKKNIKDTAMKLAKRNFFLDIEKYQTLEKEKLIYQKITQALQEERNILSKKIGIEKIKNNDISLMLKKVKKLGEELKHSQIKLNLLKHKINNILHNIPNIPTEDTPIGKNKEIRTWGKIKNFNFKVQDHVNIGTNIGEINFNLGAKLTGSRFVVMFNHIARLQRAISQFMIDLHIKEHGYIEVYIPYIVNKNSLFGTGQLPKFSKDIFTFENDMSLIPTAEVSICNIIRNERILSNKLPIKWVGYSSCFRKEAGSYGSENKGLIRQHQFEKVELVQVVLPSKGLSALEEITSHAEKVLQKLNLPYRVVSLSTNDLGFSSCKTYDLEVWIPSQKKYREVSSCSWCTDFQSRRMNAKFKNDKSSNFLHTLNASGLAVGRTLVAVIENNQQKDGSILIPEVLYPYMDNLKIIHNINYC